MGADAAMVINIFSGLPGMRNIGLAKRPHRSSSPVLRYAKFGGDILFRFSPIKGKVEGGVSPPPSGRGLRNGCKRFSAQHTPEVNGQWALQD